MKYGKRYVNPKRWNTISAVLRSNKTRSFELGDDYLVVPIQLVHYCLINRKLGYLQLYLYLKFNSSGRINSFRRIKQQIMTDLSIKSRKTMAKRINWLNENNWISIYGDEVCIWSWNVPFLRLGLDTRAGVKIYISDLQNFKACGAGACIGNLINWQRRIRWLAERNKSRSLKVSPKILQPVYYGLANKLIAQLLGISKSQAIRLKHLANKYGYLDLKPWRRFFSLIQDFPGEINELKITKYEVYKGKIYERLYDEITPMQFFKQNRHILGKKGTHIISHDYISC